MYRYADQGIVYWPVPLRSRAEDGTLREDEATIGYRILTRDELRARDRDLLLRAADNRTAALRAGTSDEVRAELAVLDTSDAADADLLAARVVDWRGIVDASDAPIPFRAEVLHALMRDALVYEDLLAGLIAASRGAVRKNSLPGPVGSAAAPQATTEPPAS